MIVHQEETVDSAPLFHPFQCFSLFPFLTQFLAYLRLVNMEALTFVKKGLVALV